MPMTPAALATLMATKRKAAMPADVQAKVNDAELQASCQADAEAIVTFLQANATVTIVAGTIVTTGGPATQTGPALPIILPLT